MKALRHLLLISLFWCDVNSGFAQTWTQTSAPSTDWQSIASSADGAKLVALPRQKGICVSTNSGITWQNATNEPSIFGSGIWGSIAASADGNKLVAEAPYNQNLPSNGGIFTSINSGISWTQSSVSGVATGVACSADGTKMAMAIGGGIVGRGIYMSTNSGASWSQTSTAPGLNWSSIAASPDWTKLAAAAYGDGIYISTDSGATWPKSGASNANWSVVVSSADGSKLTAVDYLNAIYTSTNSGATWVSNSIPVAKWRSVASSADGCRLIAAATNGLIYTSTNSGNTWQSNSVPTNYWYRVVSSADGTKLVAAVHGGGIYTSYTPPKPSLSVAISNNSLALSWLVPSTNFVLQKGTNMAKANSWVTLTNTPVLNLTNLQNQIILSRPSSNLFYRLKTP